MQKGLFLISLLIGSYISGQPVIKLYGFSQPASPGTVKARNPTDPSKKDWHTRLNYTFYLESKETIKPVEVWVNQQRFAISATQQLYSPVKHPAKDSIIVPFSNKKLWEFTKTNTLPALSNTSIKLKKLIRENELVVGYIWKGKKYYVSLKKIRGLPMVFSE